MQIISKRLIGVLEFSQKTNERIRRSRKNEFIRSVFEEFEDTKSPFEIIWPLAFFCKLMITHEEWQIVIFLYFLNHFLYDSCLQNILHITRSKINFWVQFLKTSQLKCSSRGRYGVQLQLQGCLCNCPFFSICELFFTIRNKQAQVQSHLCKLLC